MPGFIRATWPHCFTISSINTTANVLSPLQVITAAQVLTPCKCLHCCKYLGARSNTTLKFFRRNVCKGGGGSTPQIRNFFWRKFCPKRGGGTPLTDKIRKVVFDPFPWTKNKCYLAKKTQFLVLF